MPILAHEFYPPVIAHRGVRAKAPENTLAAFREAKNDGIAWIETDVKLTHDGIAILMHDETLERTTNGHGNVADANWLAVQNMDAGKWFDPKFAGEPIPTLADTLRFCLDQKLRINLELKPCAGRTQATTMVAMIEAAKIIGPDDPAPLISSFNIDALIIAERLHPGWPRGLLLDAWQDDWIDLVETVGASTININAAALTPDRVLELRESGLPVLAYTVNDTALAKDLLNWGVTALFSDNPKEILQAL